MLEFIIRRLLLFIPLLFIVSIVSFIIIQLPPGDFLTSYIAQLRASGTDVSEETIQSLIQLYGLDQPLHIQYFRWIGNIITKGDFGRSFQWNKPVAEVIGERLSLTIAISLLTMLFTWVVAIPIGIYSATHQYSAFDYFFYFCRIYRDFCSRVLAGSYHFMGISQVFGTYYYRTFFSGVYSESLESGKDFRHV